MDYINKLYNIDALELLDGLPQDSVDLIILDPDYNDWDGLLRAGIIRKALSVLKQTGNILCFTKQPFDFELRKRADPHFRREIVWTFTNGGAWVSNRMPLVSHQKIYHLVDDPKLSYFDPRTGQNYSKSTKNFNRASKVFGDWKEDGKQFTKHTEGIWLRDHLHFNKPNTGKLPSKPMTLCEILVKCYSPIDGVVCDPFFGSGNFLTAAKSLGRDYVGSELDVTRFDNLIL